MKGNIFTTNTGKLVYGIEHHKVNVCAVWPNPHSLRAQSQPYLFRRLGRTNVLSEAVTQVEAAGYTVKQPAYARYEQDSGEIWVDVEEPT